MATQFDSYYLSDMKVELYKPVTHKYRLAIAKKQDVSEEIVRAVLAGSRKVTTGNIFILKEADKKLIEIAA